MGYFDMSKRETPFPRYQDYRRVCLPVWICALLLQEVEAYDGVSVLATNYKHNIDPAFFRCMKFIVEFQFPDEDIREMLWRTTIPKTTPLADDVDI